MFNYAIANVIKQQSKMDLGLTPPSVTGILGGTKQKYDKWLEKLEAGFDFKAAQERLMNKDSIRSAVSRGRKVAHAIENDTMTDDVNVNRVITKMNESMNDLNIIEKEAPLVYKTIYWGKADIVGVKDGAIVIADNKSVNKKLPIGKNGKVRPCNYKDYALQVTAYAKAHNDMFGTIIDTGLLYFVEGDGSGELTTQTIEIDINSYWDEWTERVQDYYKRQTIIKQRELMFQMRRLNFK